MSTESNLNDAPGGPLMAEFLNHSPLVAHLGIELAEVDIDTAVLRMPFAPQLATFGDVIHGGALGALMDTAAMVAAWSNVEPGGPLKGATVDLHVTFLAAAKGADVLARTRVLRRGSSLCFLDVDAHVGDKHVARAVVTYKIG